MINYNFHTHHDRCKHATGTIEDYVKVAIERGVKYLGISCHLPYPDKKIPVGRMGYEEIEVYFEEIKQLKEKYKKDIIILSSLECEYYAYHMEYYKRLKEKCDYLLLGYHFVELEEGEPIHIFDASREDVLIAYAKGVKEALDTGLFACIAHPDTYLNSSNIQDELKEELAEIILRSAQDNDVMIEINANGRRERRNYPNWFFFKYAKEHFPDVKILVNSDAHSPEAIHDEAVIAVYEEAKEMALNIVEDGKEFIQKIETDTI